MWEPGKGHEGNMLSEGLCCGQVVPTCPEELWSSWAAGGSLIWEMHQHKAGHSVVLVKREKSQRGLRGEKDSGLSLWGKTVSSSHLFAP